MVSVYVKAAVIAVLIFAANAVVVKYLDDSRNAELTARLAEIEEETQSSRIVLLYMQILGEEEKETACPALEQKTSEQITKALELVYKLQQANQENLLANLEQTKRKYILTNTELYLHVIQLKQTCKNADITPVIYFYPDKTDCFECKVQAGILDSIVAKCKNVRVFAFPSDIKIGLTDALLTRYKITRTPSVVANEVTLGGLHKEEDVMKLISCTS